MSGYIGVDFDGTLVVHTPKSGIDTIGKPIDAMVDRVKAWLAEGQQVRIITARVADRYDDRVGQHQLIQAWCLEHLGHTLVVQSHKCGSMYQLWDDRAIGVVPNTGLRADEVAVDDAVGKILTLIQGFINNEDTPIEERAAAEHLQGEIARGAWR